MFLDIIGVASIGEVDPSFVFIKFTASQKASTLLPVFLFCPVEDGATFQGWDIHKRR